MENSLTRMNCKVNYPSTDSPQGYFLPLFQNVLFKHTQREHVTLLLYIKTSKQPSTAKAGEIICLHK